jgi:hypothetical protein
MPGKILGTGAVTSPDGYRRPDRWLNFLYAFPPERDIRDKEDSPGGRNPYNLWPPSDLIGGEETGMTVMKIVSYDDDLRFTGHKPPTVITGQTVDPSDVPIGGMLVELYLVAPLDVGDATQKQQQFVTATRSDANGLFAFTVPNTTNLYKVEATDGARQGVTVRNLTGA